MRTVKKIFHIREMGLLIPLVVIMLAVWWLRPVFLSQDNIVNILRAASFNLIVAIGITFVLIAAGLDLSVGAVLAFGGAVTVLLMNHCGLSFYPAAAGGVLSGVLAGLVNGYVIYRFEIPSLIMTLGMQYIIRGILNIITRGQPIYPLPREYQDFAKIELGPVPLAVAVSVVLALAAHVALTRSVFGRSVCAIGGNAETARLSGINVRNVSIQTYALCAGLAALSGIFMTGRIGSAQPTSGVGIEMIVITASVIGGTSMFGGSGSILGTFIGVVFMSVIYNSMTILRISVYWQNLVIGVILILAVIADTLSRKRRERRGG